jgi:hypothetical protein
MNRLRRVSLHSTVPVTGGWCVRSSGIYDEDPSSKGMGTDATLRRLRRFGTIVLCHLGVVLTAVSAYGQTSMLSTPQLLLTTDPRAFAQWVETARPEPVSAEDKARLLGTLPAEGEITKLNDSGRRKLASLSRLLHATARHSVYEIKVVDVPLARVGLYARAVVLISEAALRLLGPAELQALVAHEIGHEYVRIDYERASRGRDHIRLKELELLCDALGIVRLHALNMNASVLTKAVEKITRYNRQHFGAIVDESGYPTLSERREFARAVSAWAAPAGRAND